MTNKSASKFKEIKSPALFQPILGRLDGYCVAGQRDPGQVGSQTLPVAVQVYKCQLDLKKQIMDWMVTAGHFNVRGSWEDLCIKYPKGDLNALVDTWSNVLKDSKMADRKFLPAYQST